MIHKTDRSSGRKIVILFAGELYVSSSDELLMTTVGGCVSVCITDGNRAGMNHYLLPQPNKLSDESGPPFLYGANAIIALICAMEQSGSLRKKMRATIVGGADSFSNKESPNVLLARLILESEDIHIHKIDVGGNLTRKILIDPVSGLVTVHKRKGIFDDGKDTRSFR